MNRIKPAHFFLSLAVIIALSAGAVWWVRSREIVNRKPPQQQADPGDKKPGEGTGPNSTGGQQGLPKNPDDFQNLRNNSTPAALVNEIAKALERDDYEGFARIAGITLDEDKLARLREFNAARRLAGLPLRVREVGETGVAQGSRWAIEFGEEGQDVPRIYLDMKPGPKGWVTDKVTLPGEVNPANADALAIAENFLQSVLAQDFLKARQHVDAASVSDARIAGLCIVFEEGQYRMRTQKPLRLLTQRDTLCSFLANVVAVDGSDNGQFGLNLTRKPGGWKVTEINLDRLLSDYAQRVAGGDAYYSPLVRNPAGGDTLALYFGFDEDQISPRTRRQLEIVASILKTDEGKKLNISGHTDAKGTDGYNHELSERRAEVVKAFLLEKGVKGMQIVTSAKGSTQPRRPNFTETGADNPDGRKVNRRTEIYLDF